MRRRRSLLEYAGLNSLPHYRPAVHVVTLELVFLTRDASFPSLVIKTVSAELLVCLGWIKMDPR